MERGWEEREGERGSEGVVSSAAGRREREGNGEGDRYGLADQRERTTRAAMGDAEMHQPTEETD